MKRDDGVEVYEVTSFIRRNFVKGTFIKGNFVKVPKGTAIITRSTVDCK